MSGQVRDTEPAEMLARIRRLEVQITGLGVRITQASNRAERVAEGLDDLEGALGQLDVAVRELLQSASDTEDDQESQLPTLATSADDLVPGIDPAWDVLVPWVEAMIASRVRKVSTTGEGGGIRWCSRWFDHPDAVERFWAIYLAWTEAVTAAPKSPTWLSVWLRDHLDPHLAVVTDPAGPFFACTTYQHDPQPPLGQAAYDQPEPQLGDEQAGDAAAEQR
ncbi:DUF4913 domain-containing protein [Solihabitans fulvus]|uniref:DUF4913 domain-containing protein n=1 Tax=Solihabitans fulvus TaxID=1892852 RepID=A0A5B2XF28_9PSEU|nr:DUF4913 domain-containing protein [Solihabitans fulvus]KAA2261521.1 DUF4913 domain-containing protein [Solihabitans fulvus]